MYRFRKLFYYFTLLVILVTIFVKCKVEERKEFYDVSKILRQAQQKIEREMLSYNFTVSGVSDLEYMLVQPRRTLIVSSWRTGSTFLGEILNTVPGTYYMYEPLWHLGVIQIKEPPLAEQAVRLLKKVFECDFRDASFKEFFQYHNDTLGVTRYFTHNTRLWEYCKMNQQLCLDPEFMSKFCSLFPIHSVKSVCIRLAPVEQLLQDTRLNNLRVILLIRDPRAMMQSRMQDHFCIRHESCSNPERVCEDMVSDHAVAERLRQFYPDRLTVLRFEDLALNTDWVITELLKFLKLDKTEEVDRFLSSHTMTHDENRRSTVRISKDIPFKWRHQMPFSYVNYLQGICKTALDLWGYRLAGDASELVSENFMPLGPMRMHQQSDNQF